MIKLVILICAIAAIVPFTLAIDTITPVPVTPWGVWATDYERCPEGTATQGFDILVEDWSGPVDDTSMNGLRLYCGQPEDGTPTITSNVGHEGKWGGKFRCDLLGYITGFQLKVEVPEVVSDETATNNIRIFCSKNNGKPVEGDGERWGEWGEEVHCPTGQVVCGLKTQVHEDQGIIGDDTGLNNISMECCLPPALV